MKSFSSSLHSQRRGVALIITLFFLVLISMISIGYITTARIDRTAASGHYEKLRAESLANDGLARVVATLQRETGDPPLKANNASYYPRNWVSQPGSIVVTDARSTTDRTRLFKTVSLSSGDPSDDFKNQGSDIEPVLRPAELNIDLISDQRVAAETANSVKNSPVPHLLTDQLNAAGNPISMKVRWIYVRKNGEYVYGGQTPANTQTDLVYEESPVTTDRTNPIVGRFAYWTDDESSKVNYNLAWTRDPTVNLKNLPGNQTMVDLRGIGTSYSEADAKFTPGLANELHRFITTDNYSTVNRFFNSPLDVRQLKDDTARKALDMNKFSLTHYNADPDTTYYGRPRMVLTTQRSRAVVRDSEGNPTKVFRPFLDILKTNGNSLAYIDPGTTGTTSVAGTVDPTKLTACIKNLVDNYLKRSDWPMVDGSGHSLQEKYYGTYSGLARDQRLAQVALNIIEYVRSAESARGVVQPIRAKWVGDQFLPDFVNQAIQGTDDTFKGLTRGPLITEVGMWISDTPDLTGTNKNKYHGFMFMEVHLPLNYGLDQIDLKVQDQAKWTVYNSVLANGTYFSPGGVANTATELELTTPQSITALKPFVWEARNETNVNLPGSMTILKAGQYRTITYEFWRSAKKANNERANFRLALTLAGGPRIDVVPLAGTMGVLLDGPGIVPPGGTSFGTMSSVETRDPRVNGLQGNGTKAEGKDWVVATPNTFGGPNRAMTDLFKGGTSVIPPQDLDRNKKITDVSMRMPYPFKHIKNLTGVVRSTGELGLIHTGIEGSSSAPAPGIPFRSLHLQPSGQNTSVVPDWAFMDLFTVPTDVPAAAFALFSPRGSSTGGRVNMNSHPAPFTDLKRVDPLTAVFYDAKRYPDEVAAPNKRVTLAEAQQIAASIYDHSLSAGVNGLPGGKNYPQTIDPVTKTERPVVFESPGEVVEIKGVADQGEENEELVREISNLITARGNVFSVYTVGQALKQTPTGKLVVTGEQRQQHFVERYLIDKRTPELEDDEVRIRVAFSRNLTP